MIPSGGETLTGLRLIWAGLTWIFNKRRAPWSAVPMSATLEPRLRPWYDVRLFCLNERPIAIELLTARSIRPKGLTLGRFDGFAVAAPLVPGTEAITLPLGWIIPERATRPAPFERRFLVNLASRKGEMQIDFELRARLLDNKRTELPILVRTNALLVC